MESQQAIKIVTDAYLEAGAYVNAVRALPRIEDGLKIVQRRLLLAARECGALSHFVKSARVIGDTIGKYHPHGDSAAYDALVTLVNKQFPLFIGQGNWGNFAGFSKDPPAAYRYTEVKLSEIAKKIFLRYVDHAPLILNDILRSMEPEYLPTPVPYCLLSGTSGSGFGVKTIIPPFTADSINTCIKEFLKTGKIKSYLIPAPFGDGWVDCDDENVKKLNTLGYGYVTVGADVTFEFDETEDKDGVWVQGNVWRLTYRKIVSALKGLLTEKVVFLRDDSDKTSCVVIHRAKGIKRVNDEELLEKVKAAMTKTLLCTVFVSDGKKAVLLGVRDWLQTSLEKAVQAYGSGIEKDLKKLALELKFHEVRKELAAMLTKGDDYDVIRKRLKLTEDEMAYCLSKSVRALSAKEFPIEKIKQTIAGEKGKLKNLNASYLEHEPWSIKTEP